MNDSPAAGAARKRPNMRLEHVNIVVTAIEPTVRFVTAAFPGWRVRGRGNEPFAGMAREWVHVGDDDNYLALTAYDLPPERKGAARDLKSPAPGLAHVGFEVADIDAVVARLRSAGFEPDKWGADHPFRRNVYFLDGEGLEFEFVEYASDDPAEKNSYAQ
ncbi:MAG: VOC family protein [Parvularculaceae bacterium]|nr:VOC family protein [Parvularculaceae bacterium]